MGTTVSANDNEQDKQLVNHNERITRLEKDVESVLKATGENTVAITELRVTSANLVESTKALLDVTSENKRKISVLGVDIKWMRVIGSALAGIIGTAITLYLTGAIKV